MARDNDLQAQFKELQKAYLKEINTHVEKAVHETAEDGLLCIEGIGGYDNHRKAKNYRKNFYLKPEKGNLSYSERLANKQYQLTHLLENGHVVKNAQGEYGRSEAYPHWEPTEKFVQEELEKRLANRLEG